MHTAVDRPIRIIRASRRFWTGPWALASLLAGLAGAAQAATPPALPFEFEIPAQPLHDAEHGIDFEPGNPARFSMQLPEGSYRVIVTTASKRGHTSMRIYSEQRRLMEEFSLVDLVMRLNFVVNVRTPALAPLPANATGGTNVALKPREIGALNWDDKLSLEFAGDTPLQTLRIESASVPTLYLAGDSTVTDQPVAPNASWGQVLPRFFGGDIVVANHAESGETLKSFVTEMRFDKLLSNLKAGDWVMIQFGHNDQKVQWPQTYADAANTYRSWLRTYIAEVRRRGATPILVTSPERRNFDAQGKITPTLADYAEAMRVVAREENAALIDLNAMSIVFYEALGPKDAPRAFADEGRDKTHFNEYGGYILARCVVQGLRKADPTLVANLATHLASDVLPFDPARPEAPR